ncbi:MAG: zinc-binding dehydrogenase [Flavobacteriales bacterium]|nr:zinc-binding dehydrogenase [Flavobacteriales bacterium]
MKAWTLTAHGDPHRVFALCEHATPEPKDGEVLIECEGFGINYADVMASKGLYREAPPTPSVLGYEVVGRVRGLGPGAPSELLGQRVVGMTRFGGYAQFAVTDHRAVCGIPEGMPLGTAAALATQGCTAWYATHLLCPLREGQRVLIHSAAGGVGHLLVQLAMRAGCEVYAVASGSAKVDYVRSIGAKHVFDRAQGDHRAQLEQALRGAPLDVVFNAVGGASFKQDMRSLGSGGRIVLFGGAERGALGPLGTLRFVWRMGIVVPILLMMKSRSILGLNMLRIAEDRPQDIAECLRSTVEACAKHHLSPHVHGEYSAAELPRAMADLAGGATMGKLVVRWSS